jgi:hypothetical protein
MTHTATRALSVIAAAVLLSLLVVSLLLASVLNRVHDLPVAPPAATTASVPAAPSSGQNLSESLAKRAAAVCAAKRAGLSDRQIIITMINAGASTEDAYSAVGAVCP